MTNATGPRVASAGDLSIPLFVPEIEQLGGAERSLLALARHLYSRGRNAHLLTYIDHCNFAQYADLPLRIDVLGPDRSVKAKITALRRYLAARPANAPAVLASGYQPALHLVLAGTNHFHCLMHDTPTLFGDEGTRSLKGRLRIAISNRIIGYGFRRGHGRMIVTSEFLRDDCRRQFGVTADIVRMGGMGQPCSFRRRPVRDQLRLLSVCRIEPNKRIDWMLDALAALEAAPRPLSSRIDWRLDLAGKGALLEPMRRRVEELRLAGRVVFHGFVPDSELEALYDQAHGFLMPAVQGYGIPAIEALQRGIPVLLHRESGVSDILLDTPWATVLTGGPEEMTPKLAAMIEFLLINGQMTAPPPPDLPTEEQWAEQVIQLCGYV